MSDQKKNETIDAKIVEQFRVRSDPTLPLDAVLLQLQGSTEGQWYLLRATQVDELVKQLQGWRGWIKKKMS